MFSPVILLSLVSCFSGTCKAGRRRSLQKERGRGLVFSLELQTVLTTFDVKRAVSEMIFGGGPTPAPAPATPSTPAIMREFKIGDSEVDLGPGTLVLLHHGPHLGYAVEGGMDFGDEEGGRLILPDFALCGYDEAVRIAQREARIACIVLVSEEHDVVAELKRPTSAQTLTTHLTNTLLPRITAFLQTIHQQQRTRALEHAVREEQDRAFALGAQRDGDRLAQKALEAEAALLQQCAMASQPSPSTIS
ncbi:hypothetical protein D9611_007954 [Ephemerocybe angulata]|uniref:Peptidylprolyl isomerase n=1 Tax=Ephemerocybe angulata TaxID=980116 RepID=A0A8H5CGN9_9AGAR|nr:hypothetical protein D9611_007954 [Tulosesus angulatus]